MENESRKRGPVSSTENLTRKRRATAAEHRVPLRRLDPNAQIIQKGVCVSTRLLPDVLAQLDELAERRGLSRGHLVRELVQEAIENEGVAAS